jgi:4-hydroxybenzoate polyprenyltransferase
MRVVLCIAAVFGGPIYMVSQAQAGSLSTTALFFGVAFFVGGLLGLAKTYRDMMAPRP